MKKSLLEIAKAERGGGNYKGRRVPPSIEEVELIVAHLRGEVTVRQAAKALGMGHPGSVVARVPVVLRWGLAHGIIKITQ